MLFMVLQRILAAVLMFAATATIANAQYQDRYGQQRESRFGRGDDGQRNVAGQFDYYALVLSWSPTYCAESDDDLQCNRRDGRRFNFVLHGLWPQYDRGFPEYCQRPAPRVNRQIVSKMLDLMPAPGLIFNSTGTAS